MNFFFLLPVDKGEQVPHKSVSDILQYLTLLDDEV